MASMPAGSSNGRPSRRSCGPHPDGPSFIRRMVRNIRPAMALLSVATAALLVAVLFVVAAPSGMMPDGGVPNVTALTVDQNQDRGHDPYHDREPSPSRADTRAVDPPLREQPRARRPAFLDEQAEYLWPTDASRYMSSSFAETRSSHFHAAMDIGTWGVPGYQVFAARDGLVKRATVSPSGYGNAVYLKHSDGSTSIYAHLMDFEPRIRAAVDSIRFQDYRFRFNRDLSDLDIRIEQGEPVGLSGGTGVGPPHLHFELRTPSGDPFNPLLTNLQVTDTTPPRFQQLAVEPLSPDAIVMGSKNIHTRRATRNPEAPQTGGSEFDFGTVEVEGTVGLAVDVFDQADARYNPHAVYELELKVNGEPYFYTRADSFPYSKTRQMFLDRVYPILRENRTGFQRLYVTPGNTLPWYETHADGGKLRLPPGEHRFTVTASDISGNKSSAHGTLQVHSPGPGPLAADRNIQLRSPLTGRTGSAGSTNPPGPANTPESSNQPTGEDVARSAYRDAAAATRLLDLSHWHWHHNWIAPPRQAYHEDRYRLLALPKSTLTEPARLIDIAHPRHAVDLSGSHSHIIRTPDGAQATLHRILPDTSTTIRSQDHRVSARFPAGSVADTLSVRLTHRNGLQAAGDTLSQIRLEPSNIPLMGSVALKVELPGQQAGNNRLRLYRANASNGRRSYTGSHVEGQTLHAQIRQTGTFVILEDTDPPEIERPRLYRRSDGKWEARVTVEDTTSGIDDTSARFYINSVRGIAEYDAENRQLRYHFPGFTPNERNHFQVSISDRAGNRTTESFTVTR